MVTDPKDSICFRTDTKHRHGVLYIGGVDAVFNCFDLRTDVLGIAVEGGAIWLILKFDDLGRTLVLRQSAFEHIYVAIISE